MVRINGPLMSVEASGKIGERLVFSKRKSGQQARFQKAQKDVVTTDRTIYRALYSMGVSLWKDLTDSEKDVFVSSAKILHMTGYNLFMKEYLLSPFDTNILSFYGLRIYGRLSYGLES